jgi:predicted DNA-binding protein YlxM (UPF0122 family)
MTQGLTGRLRVIRLVDLYGRVLTAHQQRLLHLYFLDDLSLGEIAERLHITRQAVFDSLRRSVRQLERIETSLGLAGVRQNSERRRRSMHTRLDALERALRELRGRVAPGVLGRITRALSAMRRAVE